MYYKVVSPWMKSIGCPPSLQLTYIQEKWTKPVVGKLMVFETLPAAIDFYEINGGLIFSCEAVNPQPAPAYIPNPWYADDKQIFRFWNDGTDTPTMMDTPSGTILADAVKLISMVHVNVL